MEQNLTFADLGLSEEILQALEKKGYGYPTRIQAEAIPEFLQWKDVIAKAPTGTGKTFAFGIPMIEHIDAESEDLQGLILAPTRELAIQICDELRGLLTYYKNIRVAVVYGGAKIEGQIKQLKAHPQIVVATPGRLMDHYKRHTISFDKVQTVVLDEADRMLDMGFIPDVSRIMNHLPPKDRRATMLYSATLTDDVMRLASRWMAEPVKAEVESDHNATDTVRQVVYVVRADDKFKVLFNHIALHPDARAIVFCNRKATTEDVYESLKCRGVSCEMLSGDVNQNKRLKVLEDFREGAVKIVVATDVAGRGIHVDDVEYVINFDFPYEAEDYVHRIGRTGRAGNTGIAISFADEDESFAIPEIEAYIKEPLKCTIIQDDDPLLKGLPARHTKLGEVDEAAKAEVDAREAVTEEQKAAAAALVGGMVVRNAAGQEGRVIVQEDLPPRPLPTFENALEPKKVVDETDVYSKPVEQKQRFEEWSLDAPVTEAKAETPAATAAAEPTAPTPPPGA